MAAGAQDLSGEALVKTGAVAQENYSVVFNSFTLDKPDESVIPSFFTIDSCECACSCNSLKKEILILLEIAPGVSLTREQFLQGIERLRKKERFTRGVFTFNRNEASQSLQDSGRNIEAYQQGAGENLEDRQALHEIAAPDGVGSEVLSQDSQVGGDSGVDFRCVLECEWIIRSLKLEGISTGKDDYFRHYELAGGDSFVQEKHDHSCKALKNFLQDQGYYQGEIVDRLEYDEKTKTVTIILGVKKGSAFKIKRVESNIVDENNSSSKIALFVQKKCAHLIKKTCSKERIDKLMEDLKVGLQDKGYRDVKIEATTRINDQERTGIIECLVTLGKRKKTVFFGNHFFSSDVLYKKRIDFPAEEVPAPLLVMGQEVEDEYRKKGFLDASIETREDATGQEFFVVKEGARFTLKKINLKGIAACDHAWVQKTFFKDVLKHGYLDEEKNADAIRALRSWYKTQGFWDVQIVKHEHVVRDSQSEVVLEVTVHEGVQKRFVAIVVEGDDLATQALIQSQKIDFSKGALSPRSSQLARVSVDLPQEKVLKERVAGKQDKGFDEIEFLGSSKDVSVGFSVPFSKDMIAPQKIFLTKYFRDQGYVHAKISYSIVDGKKGTTLVWDCIKGQKGFFKHTILRGFTTVPYDRLMQLLSYQEDDVWNKDLLQQSVTTLRSLGIFDRVNICPDFKHDSDDDRDTILMIKDDDPFEIKVRAGFAQVSNNHLNFKKGSTYTCGGSFFWKNPTAMADKISVEVDFNKYEHRFNTSYFLPLIGSMPLKTVFKGYANKYIQPIYIGSSKPLYQVIQQGFLTGLSKKKGSCDMGLTAGFEWMETNDISLEVAAAIDFDPSLVDKKIPYFFIEPMLYADYLDDKVNPTKGFFFLMAGKGMFPFKKSSYVIKIIGEQGAFIPLSSSVLALRFRAGHIFGRQFSAIMPPERFFLGGPNSLRGYLQDYCPPLGAYVTEQGEIQDVPRGGKTMLNMNIELRFPVSGKLVWGTLFQDFGVLVGKSQELFQAAHPLAATGFGVRYMTPVGPLRFDIGWKWKKERPEASSYAWFLAFGNAF